MKAMTTFLLLSVAPAFGWQTFNSTTITPNGPQFTYGNIQGYGQNQQFNTTTITPNGAQFGYGSITRYGNTDQFNYQQFGGGQPPQFTWGNVYRSQQNGR